MRSLSNAELNLISGGAGIFDTLDSVYKRIGKVAGNIIIDGVKIINDVFNTHLFSSVFKVFDYVGLSSIHNGIDKFTYYLFKDIVSLGEDFGGDSSKVDYHYEWEWGE